MPKIFISAGDPSGDMHAARLMNALRAMRSDIEFVGIGGTEMTRAGLQSLIPISEISVVGFWEVAKNFNKFLALLSFCDKMLASGHFDAVIPVDYPGFNLKLAAKAKKYKIPVLWYIAPQLWAWGENRAAKLARAVDKLYVVFPFEQDYFRRFAIDAEFVGHPLLDVPEYNAPFRDFSEREDKILLFPGSRRQEIAKHASLLVRSAELLHAEMPEYEIAVAKNNSIPFEAYRQFTENHPYIRIEQDAKQAMLKSKVGIVKTGTSNLESALAGMPFAMYYLTSFLTYYIGKKVINLDYISLINILEKRLVIKEFIQQDATPEAIVRDVEDLCKNPERYREVQEAFMHIKNQLGNCGAAKNIAKKIINLIGR